MDETRESKRIKMPVLTSLTPYVAYLVSEVSVVKSMERWSNVKVKVLGRLQEYDAAKSLAVLVSVDEPGNFKVKMNLALVNNTPILNGNLYQVFGELDVEEGAPIILVKIICECNTIDTKLFQRSNDIIRKRFPYILK